MGDAERRIREELSRIATEARLRPDHLATTLQRVQKRNHVLAAAGTAILLLLAAVASAVVLDQTLQQDVPVAPYENRNGNKKEQRKDGALRVETRTLDINDQPLAVAAGNGSIWVTTGMRRQLLEIRGGRIVNRYQGGGTGLAVGDDLVWQTRGGDGAEPDGELLALDSSSGEVVRRLEFPNESPNGIAVTAHEVFVSLAQRGHLLRLDPTNGMETRVALEEGLGDVIVAHGAAWVAQPGGGKLWRVVVSQDESNVEDIRPAPEGVKSCPGGLAATQDAVWVADACAAALWQLDTSGKVLRRINDVGHKPADVAAGPRFIFVSSFRGHPLVTLIDRRTNEVVTQVKAGEGPSSIVADGEGAWVANSEGRSLTRVMPGDPNS